MTSAFVRLLAAVRDLVSMSGAVHLGVLGGGSNLAIPGLRSDQFVKALAEVLVVEATVGHSLEGPQDPCLCMKITMESLAKERAGGDHNSQAGSRELCIWAPC